MGKTWKYQPEEPYKKSTRADYKRNKRIIMVVEELEEDADKEEEGSEGVPVTKE